MKPQKAMTRAQLDSMPEVFRKILSGIQMNDPETWKYLFELAVSRMGSLMITEQDLEHITGLGVLGLAIDCNPPRLGFTFVSGNPQKLVDRVERARSQVGKETIALDPDSIEKDRAQ